MTQKFVPELLAPAGSMKALKAAVNAGADAVYLSGKNFGARQYAENFSKPEMEEALNYAHLRGLKVYVTVNTLIKEFELEKVAEYLLWLYEAGADALIIQDVGAASVCKELANDLDIHASTQMTINSLEGVIWAHDFGFKRVILSREMKLNQIEEMAGAIHEKGIKNKIELEIFAHGALCYSYSGQCLLSSFIGGRSGNRGRCAQPCRKPYEILRGKKDETGKSFDLRSVPLRENYLLSTHDLALYNNLDRVCNLEVNSLKIEGRMRSPEYVALVVCIYRKALDAIASNQSEWVPDDKDISRLKLAFNRGFTSGYLLEANEDLVMGREAPGNRGLYLGKVRDYDVKGKTALIGLDKRSSKSGNLKLPILETGDGVVFKFPHDELPNDEKYGMFIEDKPKYSTKHPAKLILRTKRPVPPGSKIYITRDNSLINAAQNIINRELTSYIPLDLQIDWDKENKPLLKGEFSPFSPNNPGHFEEKHSHKLKILLKADQMEIARKNPLSREQIKNQLKKTGGTPFYIRKIDINYPGNLFSPLSNLNKIRRDFINKAEIELLKSYKPPKSHVEPAKNRLRLLRTSLKTRESFDGIESQTDMELKTEMEPKTNLKPKTNLAIYCSSLETIRGALEGECQRIYFEPFLWEYYGRSTPCDAAPEESYGDRIYELILNALELCTPRNVSLVWKWPSIISPIHFKDLGDSQLINSLVEEGLKEIMVDNPGAAHAIVNLNPHIKLSGSSGLNVWNYRTVHELSQTFEALTVSNELSKEEIAAVISNSRKNGINTSFEFLVQGNLESVISEDCLLRPIPAKEQYPKEQFWGIRDAKNRIFPVLIDDEGRTHILNSVELCLIDYLPHLCRIGFNHLVIDARGKTRNYARDMVSLYKQGLEYVEMGMEIGSSEARPDLRKLKRAAKKLSQGGITSGNFVKGLNEN